jgi:hypothetical protein
MSPSDLAIRLAIAATATWQIVEIWQHSALMAPWRQRVELWRNRLGELLRCPFCLSVWVAWLCCALLLVEPTEPRWQSALAVARGVLYGLAVSRLANLGNDLFYSYSRTPRFNR